ncbi:MAG TPA: SDR family oxidoreductase, partial [Blastocatellia bacterium]|nr:SDR family oxidoreductase [Blastocatellia bacterium]
MGKRIYLVTGGAGFIGSHICERLIKEGHHVRVIDSFVSGKEENLSEFAGELELIRGDICDRRLINEAMKDVYTVFHEAALGSVPRSVADPVSTHESNITGTLNVLLAARDHGVRRVVYASSSSVYGETPELPKREDMTPQPLSPYALSKLAGEQYIFVFKHVYGFEAVALRYFNIFGPRQDPESQYAAVVPRFVTALLTGKRPTVYGTGRQSRDFTYVENVVEANLLAAEAEGVAGRAFNIACGGRYTLLELLAKLKAITGSNIDPVHEPERAGDIRDSQAAIDAARGSLGYKVSVG